MLKGNNHTQSTLHHLQTEPTMLSDTQGKFLKQTRGKLSQCNSVTNRFNLKNNLHNLKLHILAKTVKFCILTIILCTIGIKE